MKNPLKKSSSKVDKNRPLYVKEATHKEAHKRKLARRLGTIDNLISHLLEVEKEVYKRK